MRSPPDSSFIGRLRSSLIAPRCNELGAIVPRGDPGCQLESERGDVADAAGVDLLPIVAGAVIVGVETGEEVDRRNPLGDERRVVTAPGARPLAAHAQLVAARRARGLKVGFQ